MSTIKSYTDLEQSKKLAEFLSPESADIILTLEENSELTSYPTIRNYSEFYNQLRKFGFEEEHIKHVYIPAWSLSALLKLMPKSIISTPNPFSDNYCCRNVEFDMEFYADNPVDACFEMVCWLLENKKL